MPAPHHDRPRSRHPRRGFTLVELLVVVGIIAVLVGLTLTIIPKVLRAAHGAQTSAQMTAMATAMQSYYNDFRAYPGPLPNSQVGANYYSYSSAPQKNGVYILDSAGTAQPLQLGTGALGSETFTNPMPNSPYVTGAENLVLGLLGGLELQIDNTKSPPALTFAYSDASIFPDGHTPAPLGPLNLNQSAPKRYGAYLQVRVGDLSNSRSGATPTMFTDAGGRAASDSPIPEFLDKFSNPMPILYLRANVGASGVVSYGGYDETNTALPAPYQYDLSQALGYTSSLIGTNAGNLSTSHHGLQDVMPSGTTTPVSDTVAGDFPQSGKNEGSNLGANAFAYLKDPSTPAFQPNGTTATTNATAHPRQKDAFILISPGPDGIYGTPDDIIYPGGSVSQ